MDETLRRARGMFANNGMSEILFATRELIDAYGYTGAEIYLDAQRQILCNMREEEEEENGNYI